MQKLNLPAYDLQLREQDGKVCVFDPYRKKYLIFTPEEHVRQLFARHLIEVHHFPSSLIAMEYSLKLNKMQKRCDILIFDKKGEPILLVECKAPEVKINQAVFDQIARYNIVFRVSYLIVTNGLKHYCCKVDYENEKIDFLAAIPNFEDLI